MTNANEIVFGESLRWVMQTLKSDETISDDRLVELCETISSALAAFHKIEFDVGPLIKEVESRRVVWQADSSILTNEIGHIDWLDEAQNSIEWKYWNRYRQYLELSQGIPPAVVSRLDKSTQKILAQIENPLRSGVWDRRGLVVGEVQSGKTGHYVGLICKAADSGYRLIVVLAGLHDSLRSQTQIRIDEGFLGFDSQRRSLERGQNNLIGAGLEYLDPAAEPAKAGSITTSSEDGDFSRQVADQSNFQIQTPIVLVIKKHTSILANFTRWITNVHGTKISGTESLIVKDLPILVIDDEADNASANTNKDDNSPTRTNLEIRKLLNSFERSAYIGYTATPFANIFMDAKENEAHGKDLFPRDFIENVTAPSNYFGPARVFGLGGSTEDEDSMEGLPIRRSIIDFQNWIPDKHKKEFVPAKEDFPQSLELAIKSFVLTVAIRSLREQKPHHNSMLIHVTRFKNVQLIVREQVEEYLAYLVKRMRYGDGSSKSVWDELEELFLNDFVETSSLMGVHSTKTMWKSIKDCLLNSADQIEIRTINGDSSEALDYFEKRSVGVSVIVIGGDKLSRGLTLEGLSVSYYLRASRMYDTLMQMGRWFGYRNSYEDLCRLFTTSILMDWYSEIASASLELREEFEIMQRRNLTPEKFGLKVRSSATGLLVTSPSKMRTAEKIELTYNDQTCITTSFLVDEKITKSNLENLEKLIAHLVETHSQTNLNSVSWGMSWKIQNSQPIIDFLRSYTSDPANASFQPNLMADYILSANQISQLTNWDVVLVSNHQTGARFSFNNLSTLNSLNIGMTKRSHRDSNRPGGYVSLESQIASEGSFKIKTVLSPLHEEYGLSDDEKKKLKKIVNSRLDLFPESSSRATKDEIRSVRNPSKGLILIYVLDNIEFKKVMINPLVGLAISFPSSENFAKTQYQANSVYQNLNLAGYLDDE